MTKSMTQAGQIPTPIDALKALVGALDEEGWEIDERGNPHWMSRRAREAMSAAATCPS